MDDQMMGAEYGEKTDHKVCSGPEEMRSQNELSGHGKLQPRGFVHVLWLLVVLSAFLFGATIVNVVIGIRICETSARQSMAIEDLTLSVREVRKTVLNLSKVIEESLQAEEDYDSDASSEQGRI
jgi:hypothetical protein